MNHSDVSTLLDHFIPEYQFTERHSVWVGASPDSALAAAREVSLVDMPLVRLLMRARGMRTPTKGALWNQMVAGGFVELGEVPGREVVMGTIGQMWKLSGGRSPKVAGAVEFLAFDQAGFAKAAMSLAAREVGGRCELMTETRVFATDERARRAFARYWLIIRPGSGLIRAVWLRAAKRRAETR
ncbi:MAG: hypothetical protein NVS1B3_12250 [Candidatus Dormibacteraceae bacterium]